MSLWRLKSLGVGLLAGTVAFAPVAAQVTSGSVTVLPGGQPEYRPGPGVGQEQVPADWVAPAQRPSGPGRVLATTPVGEPSQQVEQVTQLPTTEPVRRPQAQSPGYREQAITVLGQPRQPDAAPKPIPEPTPAPVVVQPQPIPEPKPEREPVVVQPQPAPTPQPAPESQPPVVTELPEPPEAPPQPAIQPPVVAEPEPEPPPEPAPISEPAPAAEPTPLEIAEPPVIAEPVPERSARRFDELPAEGAQIEAYDELLASGVEAAAEFESIDELAALQLREWMAQMRSAVEDHPSVRVAQLQAQASEAGVDQARSARLPQITLSSEVGSDRAVRDGEEQDGITGARDDLQITPTLDASLLLFDAGATRAGIEAAERRVEAGDVAAEAASDTIAFRAAQTLIDLATLRAQITLAEENLNEVRRLRAMIQERAEAGRDSPSDMFRMDSRVQEARNTLEQRVAQFNAARANYAEVFRSDPIVLGLPPAYAPVPASARSAIDRAVQRNPQIRQAEALAQAAQRDFEARRAALWPQLSLGASVTGYDVTREGEDFYDSFIGLRLNAPLFDGGGRRAQIDQAQRQANLEQARVDELRANIVRSLSEAYSGRASLRPQLESLEDQVAANRATLEAYEEQFFTGRRPLNDLVTAQRELYTSRAELLDTQGELHLQHFTIRRLTGDLLTNYGLPEGRG